MISLTAVQTVRERVGKCKEKDMGIVLSVQVLVLGHQKVVVCVDVLFQIAVGQRPA